MNNINTTFRRRSDVITSTMKVQGVTLYRFAGITSPVIALTGKTGRGAPKVFVKVRDLYSRYKPSEWGAIPEGFDYICVGSILSVDESVLKLAKTAKEFDDVLSIIYYGAAGNQAGVGEMCRFRTKECSKFCLITSGKGSTPQVGMVRVARTRLSVLNPDLFWSMWDRDFAKFRQDAAMQGKTLACRPNGTTDVMPKELRERIRQNRDVTFYDYTAVPDRVAVERAHPNYHITLSRKETKSNHAWIQSTDRRYNVAIVTTPQLKAELLAENPQLFADFDKHDLRTPAADGVGKLGLLAPKGQLRGKESGFVATTREEVLAMLR